MRLGMMKGTFELGLPSASIMKPLASPRKMRKVSGVGASILVTNCINAEPMASRLPQRCRLAMTSSPVTGLPSWNSRPLRSLKVHSRLSGLSVQLSTICGLTLPFSSVPNSVS